MDEKFRRNRRWIGFGALAIIFLCVLLCGMGTLAMAVMRPGTAFVQPSVGEEGAVPPSTYHGHGPLGMGGSGGWGPFGILGFGIGLLFKLLFFGLLLLLLLGLIKRVFWGHRHWGPPHWHKPPKGKDWEGKPHTAWGPWARHWYGRFWEEDEPGGEEGTPDTPDFKASEAE